MYDDSEDEERGDDDEPQDLYRADSPLVEEPPSSEDEDGLPRGEGGPPSGPSPFLSRLCPPRATEAPRRLMVLDVVVRAKEVLLLGRCDNGESGCMCVRGWFPYLYVRAPPGYSALHGMNAVVTELLDAKLRTYLENRALPVRKASLLHRLSVVEAKSIYGYSGEPHAPFLKIEVTTPFHIHAVRDVWTGYTSPETGATTHGLRLEVSRDTGLPVLYEDERGGTETFNSNVDAVQQFMVDTGLVGCQWVRVDTLGECLSQDRRSSASCAHEWHVTEFVPEDLDAVAELAPLRVLAFDLEAAGRRGVFPQAAHDPVIQIALYFEVGGVALDPPVLLSLKACDPIEGAEVLCFEDEGELLRAFRDLAVAFDVDVFTGFNILNFDFPYLHDRAAALSGVPPREFASLTPEESDDTSGSSVVVHFDNMSRVRGSTLGLRETEYQSAQTGKRKRTRVLLPGRVCMDMLVVIQNSAHRLDSYSLKACAEHFLKTDNKVDLPFTQITPKWNEGPAGRRELGVYCLKDAELPLRLSARLSSVFHVVEMARATGVPFDAVLQRGVLIRNTSMLLRHARTRGFVFPNLNPSTTPNSNAAVIGRQQRYAGATVLDPVAGLYDSPVGVLDFSAMYPSIIIAHNLCYSTFIRSADTLPSSNGLLNGQTDDALGVLRINGHRFVTPKHQQGLLPGICAHLLACRKRAKAAIKTAKDDTERQVMDARQMAFKIAANGMYGALASSVAMLPLMEIAESVTALGRLDLLRVKTIAEEMYPDCLVVYGDTDSVFVRFSARPADADLRTRIEAAAALTVALADRINAQLRPPKAIAFEKILSVMLLMCKKRYAAIMYPAGFRWGEDQPETLIKGLQSVRRDGCALVRELVRDVVASILDTGSGTAAAALVRARLLDVIHDRLPLEAYAIRKTLRKSYADCCKPLTRLELRTIRKRISSHGEKEAGEEERPLTYAEEEAAILAGVPLPYRQRVRLPHVNLAWRLRLKDPGAAPVPGEAIVYVMTCNGGGRASEKVETLDTVRARFMAVDREYYLRSLRVPLDTIFTPMVPAGLKPQAELDRTLWNVMRGVRLEDAPGVKRQRLAHSPLAMAFARAKAPSFPIQCLEGDGAGGV
jgi:DNA polymerase delta subunit 1